MTRRLRPVVAALLGVGLVTPSVHAHCAYVLWEEYEAMLRQHRQNDGGVPVPGGRSERPAARGRAAGREAKRRARGHIPRAERNAPRSSRAADAWLRQQLEGLGEGRP